MQSVSKKKTIHHLILYLTPFIEGLKTQTRLVKF